MAGPSKRRGTRAASSRPRKFQRLDEMAEMGGFAELGTSLNNPIVLDSDSDLEPPFDTRNFAFDELVEVDLFGNPIIQSPIMSPGSASDGFMELITSPTQLFYHDTGRGAKTPAIRSLPILEKGQRSGKAKQNELLQLSEGWPVQKNNRVVNVYLEGEHFAISGFNRHSHLHMPHLGMPDLDALQVCDLRRELARILDIKDSLSLQLEIQHAKTHAKASIFGRGLCKRFNAAWDDITVNDRHTLGNALPSQDAWLRIRISDYIIIDVDTKEISCAITPSGNATMNRVRQLIASVCETSVGAIRMYTDDIELVDEMEKLSFMAFASGSTIKAVVETRECVNCLDDAGFADFPFEPTTDECFHDLDICKNCITTWITTSLDNGNWKNITCVSGNCGAVLQYGDVKRGATDADMERYERFATRDALSVMPGFKWCLAPDCDAGQIHDDADGTEQILTCESCGFKRCTACDRAWHQDETCEQFTQRLAAQPADNDASEAWVANNSRKCPGCQSPIQKNDGCDHMTCTRCRRQFCWLCLADYRNIHRDGNVAHAQNCRYHSGNIPDPHAPHYPPPAVAPLAVPALHRARLAMRRVPQGPVANNAIQQPAPPAQAVPLGQPQPQAQAQPANYLGGFMPNWVPNVFAPAAFANAQAAPAPLHPAQQPMQEQILQHHQAMQAAPPAPQINPNFINVALDPQPQGPPAGGWIAHYTQQLNNLAQQQQNPNLAHYHHRFGGPPAYQP